MWIGGAGEAQRSVVAESGRLVDSGINSNGWQTNLVEPSLRKPVSGLALRDQRPGNAASKDAHKQESSRDAEQGLPEKERARDTRSKQENKTQGRD